MGIWFQQQSPASGKGSPSRLLARWEDFGSTAQLPGLSGTSHLPFPSPSPLFLSPLFLSPLFLFPPPLLPLPRLFRKAASWGPDSPHRPHPRRRGPRQAVEAALGQGPEARRRREVPTSNFRGSGGVGGGGWGGGRGGRGSRGRGAQRGLRVLRNVAAWQLA